MKRFLRIICFLCLPAGLLAGCTVMDMEPLTGNEYSSNDGVIGNKGDGNAKGANNVKREGTYYLVSLRRQGDSYFLVLSGGEMVHVTNPEILSGNFPGETMATAGFQILGEGKKPYMWDIRLDWLIPLTVQEITSASASKTSYSSDPVSILTGDNSLSCAFDGYLTIEYLIDSSGNRQHSFALVPDPAGKSPYDFIFLHDRHGEPSGIEVSGLVSFRLDKLPDPETRSVVLHVRYMDLKGKDQIVSFEYQFRK